MCCVCNIPFFVNKLKRLFSKNKIKAIKYSTDKTFCDQLEITSKKPIKWYCSISNCILVLGDDVMENRLKLYREFKKNEEYCMYRS